MASIEMEQAERDLAEIRTILGAWYANRDSDSVTFQNLRSNEMSVGESMMESLVYSVQPEHVLQLTVGHEAVEGTKLRRGTHDMRYRVPKELPSGHQLLLREADFYYDTRPRRQERQLYVGWIVRLTLGDMAKTLKQDGELAIVDFRPVETQAQAA
jgi:hypothetical protein